MRRYYGYYDNIYPPYVPVAERRRQASRAAAKLARKGQRLSPVQVQGRTVATTFWGKAWCENLEAYHDYENRLPRGRSYLRNGAVLDLQIRAGTIEALVSGSSIYKIQIGIKPLSKPHWTTIKQQCTGQIDSVVDLLRGKFSQSVMQLIARPGDGLFPAPAAIEMKCSCPDWAVMCKHVAAVMYGVGARLDQQPELLFVLRKVDHLELITDAPTALVPKGRPAAQPDTKRLESVFGIELAEEPAALAAEAVSPAMSIKPSETAKGAKAAKRVESAKQVKRVTSATPGKSLKPAAAQGKRRKLQAPKRAAKQAARSAPADIYQLKVTLRDSRPAIWRRLQVPGAMTLARLHDVLQAAMGWTNSHLHQFIVGTTYYSDPRFGLGEFASEVRDEGRITVAGAAPRRGAKLTYQYDFGDSWEHVIAVEAVLPREPRVRYPRCIAGARAGPPEDVGGMWGYEDFLAALDDPTHPEHENYVEWIGGGFDPEWFDLKAVTAALRRARG